MLLDALHAVVVLPPGGTEVLLQGTGHGGKHCQSCLVHVHDVRRRRLLILFLHPSHMCEGLLHGHHQPDRANEHIHVQCFCFLSLKPEHIEDLLIFPERKSASPAEHYMSSSTFTLSF